MFLRQLQLLEMVAEEQDQGQQQRPHQPVQISRGREMISRRKKFIKQSKKHNIKSNTR
jgi:hypothetical protein